MKKFFKTTLLIFTIIMAALVLDVSAASNAPATIKAGTNARVLGPYDGLGTYFGVKTFLEDGQEKYAYCINDLYKSAPRGQTLTKAKELDAGYLYILKNGYPNKSITGNADRDYYITQGAIWWYTDSIGGNTKLSSTFKTSSSNITAQAKKLVNGALAARQKGYAKPSLSISTSNTKLTKTSDGKYYQSELITITATAVSGKYSVKLSNAPSGTEVVDANGTAKTSFATNEKFRVRIPAGKVTELSYNFSASVTATGAVEKAYQYNPSNTSAYQTIITRPYVETTPLAKSIQFKLETTKVKISKQDITTKKELPGATLVIKDSNEKEIAKWVSTSEPHYISGLAEGTYTLTETSQPEGYELSTEKIKFTVVAGKITSAVMYNTPKKVTVVKISKQDITTKKELPGATLVIKDSTGKIINTWVSTNEPYYITGLKAGKYTLAETIAPKGYELSTETIEFEVKEDGKVVSVVMYNQKEETPIIEVPITDTTIPPFVYMIGIGIISAGSYLVFKYSKKETI